MYHYQRGARGRCNIDFGGQWLCQDKGQVFQDPETILISTACEEIHKSVLLSNELEHVSS